MSRLPGDDDFASQDRRSPGLPRPARRLARRALVPVERFLAIEAASGIVLIAAAVIALIWANSPWRESYSTIFHTLVGVTVGSFVFERDLHFWINDGLMTIFFFVAGLEIRREMHRGELSEWRRAALPLVAAVGGMIVPGSIFLGFNLGLDSARGWGIPTATDIAFAVGVLSLLGRRVSPPLRILLLALAVIDDVGAILIIAVFYSSSLAVMGFFVVGGGMAIIVAMRWLGIQNPWAYVPPATIVWGGTYIAGIHPTLAGVVIGLMTPVRPLLGRRQWIERADASVATLRKHKENDARTLISHIDNLDKVGRDVVSPVERLQHALHGWVAFGVMPLFAVANAGVSLSNASFSGEPLSVFVGVCVGLIVGKPLGILGLSWVGTRLGLAALPDGVAWPQFAVVGVVAGVGFTMSIFIASLAFASGATLEIAKLGIVIASGVAASLGILLGWAILPTRNDV